MPDSPYQIWKSLRRLRLRAGLTQEVLAARVGVHRTHLVYVEQGKRGISDGTAADGRDVLGTIASVLAEALGESVLDIRSQLEADRPQVPAQYWPKPEPRDPQTKRPSDGEAAA